MLPPLWTVYYLNEEIMGLTEAELEYQAYLRNGYGQSLAQATQTGGEAGRMERLQETLALASGMLEDQQCLPLLKTLLGSTPGKKREIALDILQHAGRLRNELLGLIGNVSDSEPELAESAEGLIAELAEYEHLAEAALQELSAG